jgi:2,4-dienoyl-CoA reductase (NADPH2)
MRAFERLLQPGFIGTVRTRNRIVKPGAAMLYWHEDETSLNPRVRAFYEAIVKGGVGLVIVEAPIVDYPLGGRWRRRYRIDDDRYVDGLRELVDLIHSYDCPAFMQMNHDGPWQTQPWGDPEPLVKERPIASYPVSVSSENDFHNELPRQLEEPEIEAIIEKFARAAERARMAGFDGVDINAASSHLLHNFLSPFWNRRRDAYGGDLKGRARFLLGIVHEIRRRLGREFPICVTLNGFESGRLLGIPDEECLKFEEAVEIAKMLEGAGVDAIQVRTQWIGYHVAGFFPEAIFYPELPFYPTAFPYPYDFRRRGSFAHLSVASAIKKAVSIPVIAVGKIDPETAENALRKGAVDFVSMNRALIADPDLPKKLASGEKTRIRPCTHCHTCLDPAPVKRCRVNGAVGLDEPYEVRPVLRRKRVVVLGGGPAGMEAARVAAARGHDVVLYERWRVLGGSMLLASLIKGSGIEELEGFLGYLKRELRIAGVKVVLGVEATPPVVARLSPDELIIAAGGVPHLPEVKGIRMPHVVDTARLLTNLMRYLGLFGPKLLRVLSRYLLPFGERVIVLGGDKKGCQLSEFLVKAGRKVAIVETEQEIGSGMFPHLRLALLDFFRRKGVEVLTGVREVEIVNGGVATLDGQGRRFLYAQHVIPVPKWKSQKELRQTFLSTAGEVYVIGDCLEPREIVDAISEGHRLARTI